jgi:hypothetical protein
MKVRHAFDEDLETVSFNLGITLNMEEVKKWKVCCGRFWMSGC